VSPTFLAAGSTNTIKVVMGDGATSQVYYTHQWQYVCMKSCAILPASLAKPVASGSGSGFTARLLQVGNGGATLANSTVRVEQQLNGTLGLAMDIRAYETTPVINYNEGSGGAVANQGQIPGDRHFPGLGDGEGTDTLNSAMEIVAYLRLSRGAYTFGVNSDDGFRVTAGVTPQDTNIVVGVFDGGGGASDTTFSLLAETNGIYPIRLVWYNGNGGYNLEFWSMDAAGVRTLINGTNAAGQVPVPAYMYCTALAQPVTIAVQPRRTLRFRPARLRSSRSAPSTTASPTRPKWCINGRSTAWTSRRRAWTAMRRRPPPPWCCLRCCRRIMASGILVW
jgi:hypothetical protein